MSTVDAQCPASDWRTTPLATNPTPNEQFTPMEVDYYTSVVLGAVWPAFVGLGGFAILLLAFLLWRLIMVCAACIHRHKVSKSPSFNATYEGEQGPRAKGLPLKSRSGAALRWSIGLLFIGVLAGSIYGMVKVNAKLVDQGLATVQSVEDYIGEVVSALQDGISAGNAIDSALFEIQNIVDTKVNVTDVTGQLECMRPWLESLPDPAPLKSDLESLTTLLDGLSALLDDVVQNINVLVNEISPGEWEGTLPLILQAQTDLALYVTQSTAYADAANALSLVSEVPGTVQTARDTLDTLLNSPPYDSKIATLDATAQALQDTETAIIDLNTGLSSTLVITESIITGPGADLNQTLAVLTENYVAARPCMLALRARTTTINETVMLLPDSLGEKISILNDTQAKMDAMLKVDAAAAGGQTTSEQLSSALTQAETQMEEATNIADQVNAAKVELTENASFQFSALVSGLEAIANSMAAAEASLFNMLDATNAYLAGSPLATPYVLLAPQLKAAGTSAGGLSTGLSQWLTSAEPAFTQSQQVFDQLSTLGVAENMAALRDQLVALPAGDALLQPVEQYEAQYNSLPQPFSSLIDGAQQQVVSVTNEITAAVVDSRSILSDVIGEADRATNTLEENTVGKIEQYKTDYEPDVRHYDKIRQAALYALFAVALVINFVLLAGVLLLWPAALKLAVFLLLVLFTVEFAVVVALTAGLKVGTDGCANIETQFLDRLSNPQATAIARYYFYGEGSSPKAILNETFDLNIDAALQQVAGARNDLQAGLDAYSLEGDMAAAVDQAVDSSYGVEDSVNRMMDLISYDTVNPVYVDVKQYPCCVVLDMAGGIWTGIIVTGTFIFIQCILAMVLIGMFDKLRLPGCCKWYGIGKRGQAALQEHDETFPNVSELESGRQDTADSAQVERRKAATKAPRQSKIFRIFGRHSEATTNSRTQETVNIVADSRNGNTTGSEDRRRSSAPPPPTAPPAPF